MDSIRHLSQSDHRDSARTSHREQHRAAPVPPARPDPRDLVLDNPLPPPPPPLPKDYRYQHPRPPTLDRATPSPPPRPIGPYRPLFSSSSSSSPRTTAPSPAPAHAYAEPTTAQEPKSPSRPRSASVGELSDTSMSRSSHDHRHSTSRSLRRVALAQVQHRDEQEARHRAAREADAYYAPSSVDDGASIYSLSSSIAAAVPPMPQREAFERAADASDRAGLGQYRAEQRYFEAIKQWRRAAREIRKREKAREAKVAAAVESEVSQRRAHREQRHREQEATHERHHRVAQLEQEHSEERTTDVVKFAMRKELEELRAELAKERKQREKDNEAKEMVTAKLEEDLTCAICSGILVEAHQTNSCGHVSCGSCAVNWLQTQVEEGKEPSCPLCRTHVNLYVPILAVRALDEMVKTWVEGKMKASEGPWELYNDFLDRQDRWAAWKSVHPKLFDPELFPETVQGFRPPHSRAEITQEVYETEYLEEALDEDPRQDLPTIFQGLEVESVEYGQRQYHESERTWRTYHHHRSTSRPRHGVFYTDDFLPRVNPHTALQEEVHRRPPSPGLVGARLANGLVRRMIGDFERIEREMQREAIRDMTMMMSRRG
ncbi:hypothetical protein BD324DRAFT_657808 [Kockovaella imperatae]|uniref:RING-type domain-containing protein n=1 Tax=Kockovaella imperatae TaxID=4999 RepID=A0A1Y1U8U6_9TREE|nr:hypothetical protein BD324DRAFT_657808 [Kockovaella imperatae]ORX34469.1 hypothetical protein BD324DRAFT_657808 [Kockovaella imperatae]